MERIITLLENLKKRLESSYSISNEILIDSYNKINLYLKKYFKNNLDEYQVLLNQVITKPESNRERDDSVAALKSIITTMIEDIQLSKEDFTIISEEEKNKIISNARKQAEEERKILENQANEIRKLNQEIKSKQESLLVQEQELHNQRKIQQESLKEMQREFEEERKRLLEQEKKFNNERKIQQQKLIEQEEKFNSFKAKLEIADKNLDFQSNAVSNKKAAIIWAIIALGFTIVLIILLCINISNSSTLISITNSLNDGIKADGNISTEITPIAIYIGYFKYIISRLLLYSMIIYAIVFSVKNYNAQMHNHVINNHKANAFKSTLSLLNTARSDDGNDKLLIQATQAIFSHQQSGYSGKDNEPSNPNLITNVVESISKKI